MKYIFIYIIILLLCGSVFCQNKSVLYDKIIVDIKKSKELEEFSTNHNVKKLNFRVRQYLYSFCENYNMFKKGSLTQEIIESCANDDWFSSESKKDENLKNKSDKGKKPLILYFTNTIDNYIITEVVVKKAEQESLLFLYKFDDKNSIRKIDAIRIFKN